MANAYPVTNVKEGIIRGLDASESWLMRLENKADVDIIDAEVQVGDATVTIIDDITANANNDKTITSVVADQGVRHGASLTTINYYQPVKMLPQEMDAAVRNGTLNARAQKDSIKQVNGVLKAISAVLIDALSDGVLTKTAALPSGFASLNFSDAGVVANQRLNMAVVGAPWGTVMADNEGNLPDWVAATPGAFGNIIGYEREASPLSFTASGKPVYLFKGVPFYPVNGTAAKWGAVSKPCLLFGADRHIVFKLNTLAPQDAYVWDVSTGFWTLGLNITATHGVDFTATTGLALGIGEITSGTS